MKRILLSLAVAISSYGAYAQSIFPTDGSNVGIGTTAPSRKLHVIGGDVYVPITSDVGGTGSYGGSSFEIRNGATSEDLNFDIYNRTTSLWTTPLSVKNTGNVGIGTTNPTEKLDVAGNIITNNTAWFSSRTTSGTTVALLGIATNNNVYMGDPFGTLSGNIVLRTLGIDRLTILTNGNIGIGTSTPQESLSVNGNIRSKQVKVKTANWPDYVFNKDYKLPSLLEVKNYIDKNSHLLDMPSEAEVAKNGINLGEIVKVQTKKIEELTLYLIEKDSKDKEKDIKLQSQQEQIKQQQEQINDLKDLVTKLIKQK